jgi:hypothetical protein
MSVSISGAGSISGLDQGFNVTTGNVGIGTDDASWGVSTGLIVGDGASAKGITIFSNSANVGDLAFADATSGTARYRGLIRYDHSDDSLALRTNSSERLRITSAGQLNLAGNMQFTAATPELEFNNGGPRFRVPAANTLTIHTGGGLGATSNERLRITSAGKVGIGTDDPKQVFSVVGRGNFDNNGDYYGAWINGDSTGSSSFNVGVWHNAGGRMRNEGSHLVLETQNTSHNVQLQPSGGNISVGSNNPNGLLALTAASGRILTLRNSTTGSASGDGSYLALNGSDFQIANAESANIILYTADTERLRIESSGQITLNDSPGIQLSAKTSSLYATDGALSYYGTSNFVYLNGAGTNGGLRLNAGGVENNHNAINIMGGAAGANIQFITSQQERLRIDSSGNANFRQKVSIGEAYTGGEILSVGKSSGTSYMAFHNGGANMGFIGFADQLVSGGASNQLGIRSQDAIFFATGGNTERVRLDNDRMTFAQNRRLRFAPNSSWGAGLNMGGNGNSSNTTYGSVAVTNGNLHLDPRGGSGYGSYLNWYTGGGGTYFGNGSGGQAGRIDASGNLTLSGTYPGSDLRLKENIETITGATDKIKSLVGKTFTWKPESGLDSYKRYGFIAQEVQQVVPDLVKAIGSHYFDANDNLVHNIEPTETDEDRESAGITKSLTVNSEGITPILVEAMKELIAKNEALEARIAVLEGS